MLQQVRIFILDDLGTNLRPLFPTNVAGKSGGGLFGKKPVPIEELEASHVAALSALKDKSDL